MLTSSTRRVAVSLVRHAPRSSRSIFTLPEMPHLNKLKGIPGLLSPRGLDIAWYQYQQHVLDNVNQILRGFEGGDQLDQVSLQDLILRAKTESPEAAPEFADLEYYASLAYNNEFFFDKLLSSSTDPDRPVRVPTPKELRQVDTADFVLPSSGPISQGGSASPASSSSPSSSGHRRLGGLGASSSLRTESFSDKVTKSFGSHLGLKEQMINHADAIFGNGYTWLVATQGGLGVVNTYNAGTPFSHITEQERRGASSSTSPASSSSFSSALSSASSDADVDSLLKLTDIVPLVNLNVWQHVYLPDYGVAGKRKFLENLFLTINWEKVEEAVPKKKVYGSRR